MNRALKLIGSLLLFVGFALAIIPMCIAAVGSSILGGVDERKASNALGERWKKRRAF